MVPPRVRTATKSRIEEGNLELKERIWAKTVLLDRDGNGIQDDLSRIEIKDLDTNLTHTVFNSGETTFPEIPVSFTASRG